MEQYKEPTGGRGTNTHDYDSRLNSCSKTRKTLEKFKYIYDEQFLRIFAEEISHDIDTEVSSRLMVIVNDYSKNANYDGTNDVKAEDILKVLAVIWQDVKFNKQYRKCFVDELSLQILDMKTGMCPQGRTIRLWQISEAYIDFLKDS